MKKLLLGLMLTLSACSRLWISATPEELKNAEDAAARIRLAAAQEEAQLKIRRVKAQKILSEPPTCRVASDCAFKWSRARAWILANATMKIQNISDEYIQTFTPTGYGDQIGAVVNKELQRDGGYKIHAVVFDTSGHLSSEDASLFSQASLYQYINGRVEDPNYRP